MTTSTSLPIDNPLLDTADLPRFDTIRPEHITPAIESLLAEADRGEYGERALNRHRDQLPGRVQRLRAA